MNTVLSLIQIAHTSSVAHPASYLMATRGFFSGRKMAENVTLIIHVYLGPMLRMSRAVHPPPYVHEQLYCL